MSKVACHWFWHLSGLIRDRQGGLWNPPASTETDQSALLQLTLSSIPQLMMFLWCSCSAVPGIIRQWRPWEQHGEGQMEVSEVCITHTTPTPTPSPLCLRLHNSLSPRPRGLESFNHACHPTSPFASPADQADPEGCRSHGDADTHTVQ